VVLFAVVRGVVHVVRVGRIEGMAIGGMAIDMEEGSFVCTSQALTSCGDWNWMSNDLVSRVCTARLAISAEALATTASSGRTCRYLAHELRQSFCLPHFRTLDAY
jgi:hypothetical protein